MAFSRSLSGDRFRIHHGSIVPKKPSASYVAAWNTTNTTPLVGDLVKLDSAANDQVLQCVAGDVPYGMVYSINSGTGAIANWTLSVLRFVKTQSVIFEYNGAFAVLDNIVADGSLGTIKIDGVLRNRVKHDNTNGSGTVVAKDSPVTGLAVVEFPRDAR